MSWGAITKFKNYDKTQKPIMAVEVQASAQDSEFVHSPPYIGSHNVIVRDNAFHPIVDVTIHHTDGTRQSRRAVSEEYYHHDQKKALRVAEQAALDVAKIASQKGLPVIMDTAADRASREAYQPVFVQPPNTQAKENRKSTLLMLLVFMALCFMAVGIIFMLEYLRDGLV